MRGTAFSWRYEALRFDCRRSPAVGEAEVWQFCQWRAVFAVWLVDRWLARCIRPDGVAVCRALVRSSAARRKLGALLRRLQVEPRAPVSIFNASAAFAGKCSSICSQVAAVRWPSRHCLVYGHYTRGAARRSEAQAIQYDALLRRRWMVGMGFCSGFGRWGRCKPGAVPLLWCPARRPRPIRRCARHARRGLRRARVPPRARRAAPRPATRPPISRFPFCTSAKMRTFIWTPVFVCDTQ